MRASSRRWSRLGVGAGLLLVCAFWGAAVARPPAAEYALECSGCHLMNGSGKPGAVPDMRGVIGVMARTERGRAYLVRVPGAAMSPLTDRQLAEVVNWMVDRFGRESGADAVQPFTAAEVAAHRGDPLQHPGRERMRVLQEAAR